MAGIRATIAVVCIIALALFSVAIAILHLSQESQINDEFKRRHRSLFDIHKKGDAVRTMMVNHHDLRDKFVIFLDIDGVLAPYGQDPNDDVADDDTAHFQYDDDVQARLQEHHCWRQTTDEALAAFSRILDVIPPGRARVVLSSFWRIHTDCRMSILDAFHAYGEKNGGPLKDFRWFDDRTGTVEDRQIEIAEWLRHFNPHNKVLAGWLVLDDAEIFGERPDRFHNMFRGHLVRPDENIGLTADDATMAIELIRRQLGEA